MSINDKFLFELYEAEIQHVKEQIKVWSPFACGHSETQVTLRIKNNGAKCATEQCITCGKFIREVAQNKVGNLDDLPPFDNKLGEVRWKEYRRLTELLIQFEQGKVGLEQKAANEVWRQKYEDYLQSEHWKQLRLRVIVRDGSRCQGCGMEVTYYNTHVHHLSYEMLNRLGYSMDFECITLCMRCHDAIHGGKLMGLVNA